MGPLAPPVGGVSMHIHRMVRLLKDDFDIDYVDESYLVKDNYFNIRTLKFRQYFRKVRRSDIVHIHSGKRILIYFHIFTARLFGKRILLTIHGYPWKKNFRNFIDSLIFPAADKIILVNSYIFDKIRLPGRKCVIMPAFLPPVIEEEPELPPELIQWLLLQKNEGRIIISANAYQMILLNSVDLYGLDLCIKAAEILLKKGKPVSFIFVVASMAKNRELFDSYSLYLQQHGMDDHFLLLNKELSFARLIEHSDIILRPTSSDGDALTIREALHFKKTVIASDVVPRPGETVLFKTRDEKDLAEKIIDSIRMRTGLNNSDSDFQDYDYHVFYDRLFKSVLSRQ